MVSFVIGTHNEPKIHLNNVLRSKSDELVRSKGIIHHQVLPDCFATVKQAIRMPTITKIPVKHQTITIGRIRTRANDVQKRSLEDSSHNYIN